MSYPIIALTLVFVVYLCSLFGRGLPAGRAFVWWLFLGFLLVAAISPRAFAPVARAFGIEFVSNLVLACVAMFLVFQVIGEATAQFETYRTCRMIVSQSAAERFGARRPQGAARARVLVVLPCFNEEASLPALLPRLHDLVEASDGDVEFCVVDDASRDESAAILSAQAAGRFATHMANMGVSGALITGFLAARAAGCDYVVQCDADGQHPVEAIPALVAEARRVGADMLIGSRFVRDAGAPAGHGTTESTTVFRWTGSRILSFTLRVLFPRAKVADTTSGFRVYSRAAMVKLIEYMPERYPEPELIAIAAWSGLSVREFAVRMEPRRTGVSSIRGFGSALYMVKVVSALLGLRLRTLLS